MGVEQRREQKVGVEKRREEEVGVEQRKVQDLGVEEEQRGGQLEYPKGVERGS